MKLALGESSFRLEASLKSSRPANQAYHELLSWFVKEGIGNSVGLKKKRPLLCAILSTENAVRDERSEH